MVTYCYIATASLSRPSPISKEYIFGYSFTFSVLIANRNSELLRIELRKSISLV